MDIEDFMTIISKMHLEDPRYLPEAYIFVQEALIFTSKLLNKPSSKGPERHVTVNELLEGIRCYTIEQFGPMAPRVLNSWGIKTTEDFGEIVFNLVHNRIMGSTEKDKREDFTNGYDFHDAFVKPFLSEKTGEFPVLENTDNQQEDI